MKFSRQIPEPVTREQADRHNTGRGKLAGGWSHIQEAWPTESYVPKAY